MAKPPPLKERDFRQMVIDLARVLGWEGYFAWDSIHSPRGYPDLTLCRPPRLVFAELKTGTRKVTPPQEKWLALLKGCPGVEVYVWRPEDWEEVKRVLDR